MKKVILFTLSLLFSLVINAQEIDKSLALAQKTNGIYVFTDSEPVCKYEILDRTKSTVSWSGQYTEIKNKLVKKALKEYPNADGVVITMGAGLSDKALIIKFVDDANVSNSDYAKAQVLKTNGMYVFTDCEPLAKYEILNREKVSISWTGQYSEVKNKLIKKALKDNPETEGIILNFNAGMSDKAVIVKFN